MFLKYAKKSVKYAVSMVIGRYHEMNQVWQRLAGQLSESFDSAISWEGESNFSLSVFLRFPTQSLG